MIFITDFLTRYRIIKLKVVVEGGGQIVNSALGCKNISYASASWLKLLV